MNIKLTTHIKQHAGDILLECQDSFDYNLDNLSFAVSDGVSQSYRPELWSRLLTKVFVNNPDVFFVNNQDDKLQLNPDLELNHKWYLDEQTAYKNANQQEQFILDMKKNSISIAAATFIGIKLVEDGIQYHTIGDSVLFFYDYETRKLEAYSSMMPDSGDMVFNNSPEYIDSNGHNHGNVISGILPYRRGILLMATDALSDWIAERRESSDTIEALLKKMMCIQNHEEYDKFIDCARNEENPTKLKDDDTTFIALEFTKIDRNSPIVEQNFTDKFDSLLLSNFIYERNILIDELDRIKSTTTKELRTINKQLEDKKRDLENRDKQNNNLQNELNQAILEKKSFEKLCNQLKSNEQTLNGNVNKKDKEIQRLNSEIQRLKTDKQSTPTCKDSKILNLENELELSQERERKLQDQLKSMMKYVSKTKESLNRNVVLDLNEFISTFASMFEIPSSTESEVKGIKIITFGPPTGDGGFQI